MWSPFLGFNAKLDDALQTSDNARSVSNMHAMQLHIW